MAKNDDNNEQDIELENQDENTDDNFMNDDSIPDAVKEHIRKIREQSKKFRLKAKENSSAASKLSKLEKEQQDAKDKAALENGEAVKVLETTKQQLEQANNRIKELEEIEKVVVNGLEERIKKLPANIVLLMPENLTTAQKLSWVGKAEGVKATDEKQQDKQQQQRIVGGNMNGSKPKTNGVDDDSVKLQEQQYANSGKYSI